MFGLHGWDLIIILLIVLVIFGARRLPELGSALGKSVQALQKGLNGAADPVSGSEETPARLPEKPADGER